MFILWSIILIVALFAAACVIGIIVSHYVVDNTLDIKGAVLKLNAPHGKYMEYKDVELLEATNHFGAMLKGTAVLVPSSRINPYICIEMQITRMHQDDVQMLRDWVFAPQWQWEDMKTFAKLGVPFGKTDILTYYNLSEVYPTSIRAIPVEFTESGNDNLLDVTLTLSAVWSTYANEPTKTKQSPLRPAHAS